MAAAGARRLCSRSMADAGCHSRIGACFAHRCLQRQRQLEAAHIFFCQLMDQSQRWVHPNGSVRFLHRSPAGTGGGVNAFAQRAYIPGVWQHVVAQNTGDRMELYMDGRLVGSAQVDPDQAPGLYQMLIGRLKQSGQGNNSATRPFIGSMDEIAFYEHTLSPRRKSPAITLLRKPSTHSRTK